MVKCDKFLLTGHKVLVMIKVFVLSVLSELEFIIIFMTVLHDLLNDISK